MKYFMLSILSILVSCATPYQKGGFLGGYEDRSLGNNVYSVVYKGNGYTSRADVLNMAFRRAAEICPKGYSILSSDNGTDSSLRTGFNGKYQVVNKSSAVILIKCKE